MTLEVEPECDAVCSCELARALPADRLLERPDISSLVQATSNKSGHLC